MDPLRGEFYVVAKNMPTLMRLILSNEEPTAGGALGGGAASPIITPEQKAKLMAAAKEAAAKGPVRYTSPYDFMQSPTNGMTAIGPPWSEITAYDLNTGEIKWRVPDGGVTAPPEAGLKGDTGAHMPRGGPLVTAGGLVFVATASDRTVRAYDRDNGKVVWTKELPTGIGRRSGDLRSGRSSVHRIPGCGGSWIVPGSLRRSRGGCEWCVRPLVEDLKQRLAGAAAEVEQVDRRRHPGRVHRIRVAAMR